MGGWSRMVFFAAAVIPESLPRSAVTEGTHDPNLPELDKLAYGSSVPQKYRAEYWY
jgi:hypothetical protein